MSEHVIELRRELNHLTGEYKTFTFILYEFNIKILKELEEFKKQIDVLENKIKTYEKDY